MATKRSASTGHSDVHLLRRQILRLRALDQTSSLTDAKPPPPSAGDAPTSSVGSSASAFGSSPSAGDAPASSVSLHAAYPLVGGADVEMHAPDINMEIQTPSQNQTQLNAFSNDRIGPLSEAEAACLQEREKAWLESLESRGFVMGLPEAKRKGLLPMGFQPSTSSAGHM